MHSSKLSTEFHSKPGGAFVLLHLFLWRVEYQDLCGSLDYGSTSGSFRAISYRSLRMQDGMGLLSAIQTILVEKIAMHLFWNQMKKWKKCPKISEQQYTSIIHRVLWKTSINYILWLSFSVTKHFAMKAITLSKPRKRIKVKSIKHHY